MLLNIFRLSMRNLGRHPGKNAFVAILIFLASTMFFISASISNRSRETWREYFSTTFLGEINLSTYQGNDKDYTFPSFNLPTRSIDPEILAFLDSHQAAYSKRIKVGAAVYQHNKGQFAGTMVTLEGVDLNYELSRFGNLKIAQGSYNPDLENGVLVWKESADGFKWKVGDEITLFVKDREEDSYPYSYTIMGILDHRRSAALEGKTLTVPFPIVMAPYQLLAKQLDVDPYKPFEAAIWNLPARLEAPLLQLADRHQVQMYYAEEAFGVVFGIVDYINFITLFMGTFIIVILVVATLNLNLMGYFERRREIGTMLAMGAKPRWVFGLLILETWCFSTVAFLVSLLIYAGGCLALSQGIDFGEMSLIFAGKTLKPELVGSAVWMAYGVVTCAMIVSTLYPVYLATQINPIEVFRETAA